MTTNDHLAERLNGLRRSHYVCEDCWYSCPASDECCNSDDGKKCNCGADAHNAKIDELIKELSC